MAWTSFFGLLDQRSKVSSRFSSEFFDDDGCFILLSSFRKAQVNPIFFSLFINVDLLLDEFLKIALMVTPISLTFERLCVLYQLMHKSLYGDNTAVRYSICITQCKDIGLCFEDHGVWMWMWGEWLVINMGSIYRYRTLGDYRTTVFSLSNVISCWFRLWYWFPFRYSCRRLVTILLLLKGEWLRNALVWHIWLAKSFNYICFPNLPSGGVFWKWIFFSRVIL